MAATSTGVLKHIQRIMQAATERGGFETLTMANVKLLSAEVGRVHFEIPVSKESTNAMGGTHGGWLSTIVDVGGSLAVATHGFTTTGVSTDLSVSFLSASGPGHRLLVDAQVLKMGRTLAYTRVDIFSNEKMIATGNHTKFVAREQQQKEAKGAASASSEDGAQ
ncbi:Thioesterase/thiol ester dehydrase-isomerase [Martensiomyces pterosporus]|nr:Thioesterase/thiol ester dehydrase-isomerase [Martensiomyces pterosporus]